MHEQRRDALTEDEVEAAPQLPLTDGRYFACRRCRRILSEAQWFSAGCVECSSTMGVPDRDNLLDFATPHFHNFIGLIAPGQSWVARLIMKSRAETNGIFAETLSDDDTDGDEEEVEDAFGDRYVGDEEVEEEEAPEAALAADSVDYLHSDSAEKDRDATPAPELSPAPAVTEAVAGKTADVTNAVEDIASREVKRVKTEIDSEVSHAAADAPRDEPDA
ncbi:hypothetical protein ABB37_00451 [Leptomonas pyrrhocoris]|uniref:Spt4/RpoE2 zinc finger domain-containing protein n=1 Tax=Leptomonas pyrrhocoris TaxID=157538 RepID=A0A0N0E0A3_LEPPY|nr:hypothetical protein ABB37_00451 [Leptomonas pyrrhocoris]XP_015664651.1 hypothetical protein ABB37_00451 [Leptomonas pyrrhocoris]KPA86211.1 hypothetical protein ABB37_00451 [Leptomonas pyrrhocoris]KPA86212.1 hypothetical protein ABB37_00451 [Leptomonas pyrrhocoris]|eukprot:XP_015664650.1 hypothetical protein ABB37_00451 [Leptomonas pyrrhocoris]